MTLDYNTIPALRATTIKEVINASPLVAKFHIDNPDSGDTPSRRMLRAIHSRILTPDVFPTEFGVWDGRRDVRQADYRKFLSGLSGLDADDREGLKAVSDAMVLSTSEADKLDTIARNVMASPVVGPLLSLPGDSEITITWTDPATGLACKARIDRLIHITGEIVDAKTYRSCAAHTVKRGITDLLWHVQMAHYRDGVRIALGEECAAVLAIIEQNEPNDCAKFTLSEDVMQAGERARREAMETWACCIATGVYPGRYTEPQTIDDLPAYAAGMDDPTDITFDHDED